MQSFSLLPPILESQLEAVEWTNTPSEHSVEIRFTLPAYVIFNDIKHVQVSIREKTTNNIAVNMNLSPDQQVIYIQTNGTNILTYDTATGICTLLLPYTCFRGGNLTAGIEYNIQLRFGLNNLWCYTSNSTGIDSATDWNYFSSWRANQIAQGAFGEWSNITTLFCYNEEDVDTPYFVEPTSFIPNISFAYYLKNIPDAIEKLAVEYSYTNFLGERLVKQLTINTSGTTEDNGYQVINFTLPIGRVRTIHLVIEGYTKKNIHIYKTCDITPYQLAEWDRPSADPNDPPKFSNNINNVTATLSPEEQNDGVLYFECEIYPANDVASETTHLYYDIFRINLNNFETIQLQRTELTERMNLNRYSGSAEISFQTRGYFGFKDFSVEMGEDYVYTVILNDTNNQYFIAPLLQNFNETNSGYGRLMRMDSVLLTTAEHQLRLQGNVKLSGFKRNTADAFQTTIGHQFPFYARGSLINYRTFNLEGLVTILFDKTGVFLKNTEYGLQWMQDGQMVILNRDIYHTFEYSKNNRRIRNHGSLIRDTLNINPEDKKGPLTKSDNYIYEGNYRFDDTSHTDEMIYIERKFREYVMTWLSDGQPKLFRSETEGNMIVILTGITFTPYEASGRMVYQMSCAATEIAEYNNENLLKYNLVAFDLMNHEMDILDKIKDIDPELNIFYVDDNYIIKNGSGYDGITPDYFGNDHYLYASITDNMLAAVTAYNELIEWDDYINYTSQPIIYMRLLYEGNTYNTIHNHTFIPFNELKALYQINKDNVLYQQLFAAFIKNDLLRLADYPELEDLAQTAAFLDWTVNLYYHTIFRELGFDVSLFTLRAHNYEAHVCELIDNYLTTLSNSNAPRKELYVELPSPENPSTTIVTDFHVGASHNAPQSGLVLIIDQYRNGNQLAVTTIDTNTITPLTVSVTEESIENG